MKISASKAFWRADHPVRVNLPLRDGKKVEFLVYGAQADALGREDEIFVRCEVAPAKNR